MKISYNWLKELVDFDMEPQDLCKMLTFLGVETTVVGGGTNWSGVITAKVLDRQKHPNSDHLSICKVNDGTKDYQIVCGAPNVAAGQTVPLALIGAVLPGNFTIKASKIRGVSSEGMICSKEELGLEESSDGIMVLDEKTPLGKKLEDVLEKQDTILEIEITTNRGDCLSHWGVAREIAAKLQKIVTLPPLKTAKYTEKNLVEVKDKDLCTRYIGCHITGVKIAPSPKWMKDKLESCGVKSINNVVDITNYVMLELGQPLHAFDATTLSGGKVVVRRANDGEKLATLDGKTHELDKNNLVIADGSKALAIAGVIGGQSSSITDATTEVFLEAAVFNPGSVRKTARKLNISTDASYRYERGTSWEVAEMASWRALNLITELAGGRLETREDYNSPDNEKVVINLRVERVEKLLGYAVDEKTIANILRFLGIEISSKVQNVLIAEVPSYRNDIKEEVDLIEEIARVNGYENIPMDIDSGISSTEQKGSNKLIKQITNSLVGLGFCEAMNYSFAEIKDLDKLYLKYTYKIANPISKENEVLRPSLLPSLMKNFDFNIGQATTDIKLFEVGKIFDDKGERRVLGILMSGPVWQPWWNWESSKQNPVFDFYFASGIISNILPSKEFTIAENRTPAKYYHPGKTAAIVYHGKVVGQFGVLRPDVAENTNDEVIYAEIETENIEKNYKNKINAYEHVAKFPAVKRDISVVADKTIKFEKIEKIIKHVMKDGGILKDWSLFSVYESEKLGAGKISYSFRLTYRHNDKTLNDTEVNKDIAILLEKWNKDLGISLRN
ncbi:phenylalanine--tRNA ligase subunit beta [Candidatus Ruminimicrobiellum ovillum]|uniref:phenylalanine--tRNA ligase subunit beta n=1 Tax=Candidatus Ruminimicrobiellum ovillum TaxID=1947927 RepID=UPI00355A7580